MGCLEKGRRMCAWISTLKGEGDRLSLDRDSKIAVGLDPSSIEAVTDCASEPA